MRLLVLFSLLVLLFLESAFGQSEGPPISEPGFCATGSCAALVISVSQYDPPYGDLIYSEQGARLVAEALEDTGFDVVSLYDPNRADLVSALEAFGARNDADMSLIYFVGNGGDWDNLKYIAPSDAIYDLDDETDTTASLISVTDLYDAQPGTTLRVNVMNTAFVPINETAKSLRPVPEARDEGDFDYLRSDVETLYLFSAQPGEPSFDLLAFPVALASALQQQGDLLRSFARLRDAVAVSSQLAQFPELRMQGVQSRPICLNGCQITGSAESISLSQQLRKLEGGTCDGTYSGASASGSRLALVVGNNGYSTDAWSKLSEPVRDAEVLSEALTAAGFDVRKCLNLGLDKLETEIAELKQALSEHAAQPASDPAAIPTAFFYFSGHGAADAEKGINYLIPTDSEAESATTLRGEAVATDLLVEGLEAIDARMIMVIDACRNALKYASNRSGDKGLVPFQKRSNLYIASATQPGEVASERSGYAQFLADRILADVPRHESEVDLVFRDVGARVLNETNGKQQPVTEASLLGRFYFQPDL
jgi:uncharacterized caspase-like protein